MSGQLKKNRMRQTIGQETLNQIEHLDNAGAKIVTLGVLIPGDVITSDTSAAGVLVREGSICRIQVSADTYVAFGDSDIGSVSSATSPALKLASGYHLVVATSDYIRTSANVTRLEVIS